MFFVALLYSGFIRSLFCYLRKFMSNFCYLGWDVFERCLALDIACFAGSTHIHKASSLPPMAQLTCLNLPHSTFSDSK